jgi:hypothetical protein
LGFAFGRRKNKETENLPKGNTEPLDPPARSAGVEGVVISFLSSPNALIGDPVLRKPQFWIPVYHMPV